MKLSRHISSRFLSKFLINLFLMNGAEWFNFEFLTFLNFFQILNFVQNLNFQI